MESQSQSPQSHSLNPSTAKISFHALPGFRDFYPDQHAARQYIFNHWREVARRFQFLEYDGPTLEPVDLYRKKSGGELGGQLFNFVDKGEREISLRPEMTPTIARMVISKARELKKPIKWFSIGSFYRFERPQRGRLREFSQLNCDLFGEESASADAEMIAFAVELFRSLGLTADDFVIRINDRNFWLEFLKKRGLDTDAVTQDFLSVIDKMERDSPETTESKLAKFQIQLKEVKEWMSRPALELGGKLGEIAQDLKIRGLTKYVHFDPGIVRGLAYYTGVVFEVFDRKKTHRALAGGGRFDDLLAKLSDGAVNLPAVGFAVGDVTLLDLLNELPHTASRIQDAVRAAQAPQLYVVIADENFRSQALSTIQTLRSAGWRVDFSLVPNKVGKQFQMAEQAGAPFAILFGSEWPNVKIKNLSQRSEEAVDHQALLAHLKTIFPTST